MLHIFYYYYHHHHHFFYCIFEELVRLLLISSDGIDKDTVVSSGDISTKTLLSVSYDSDFLVCRRCFLFAVHYVTLIMWVGWYNFYHGSVNSNYVKLLGRVSAEFLRWLG
jgi:hypothetical protein